jgi:hypothetical protein
MRFFRELPHSAEILKKRVFLPVSLFIHFQPPCAMFIVSEAERGGGGEKPGGYGSAGEQISGDDGPKNDEGNRRAGLQNIFGITSKSCTAS